MYIYKINKNTMLSYIVNIVYIKNVG